MNHHIILEDTNSSKDLWDNINSKLLNNFFTVESKPGIRGVCSFLETCTDDKVYHIIVDHVWDNESVSRSLTRLYKAVAGRDNIVVYKFHCFESFMLSFESLFEWAWTNKSLQIPIVQYNQIFLKENAALKDLKTCPELFAYYKNKDKSSEKLAARLLADATHGSGFIVENARKYEPQTPAPTTMVGAFFLLSTLKTH